MYPDMHKSRMPQVVQAAKFCTVAPNMCGRPLPHKVHAYSELSPGFMEKFVDPP
jgi:hypothetical protein